MRPTLPGSEPALTPRQVLDHVGTLAVLDEAELARLPLERPRVPQLPDPPLQVVVLLRQVPKLLLLLAARAGLREPVERRRDVRHQDHEQGAEQRVAADPVPADGAPS